MQTVHLAMNKPAKKNAQIKRLTAASHNGTTIISYYIFLNIKY